MFHTALFNTFYKTTFTGRKNFKENLRMMSMIAGFKTEVSLKMEGR